MTDEERLDEAFTLTAVQKKHVDSLLWLFSDDARRQGRTHLLLYIFARLCMTETARGIRLYAIDHFIPVDKRRHALNLKDMFLHILRHDLTLSTRFKAYVDSNTSPEHFRIEYRDPMCKHCHKPLSQHGTKYKCLYEATDFHEVDTDQRG